MQSLLLAVGLLVLALVQQQAQELLAGQLALPPALAEAVALGHCNDWPESCFPHRYLGHFPAEQENFQLSWLAHPS